MRPQCPRAHRRQDGLNREIRCPKVRGESIFVVGRGQCVEGRHRDRSGVINQHVDRTEPVDDVVHHALDIRAIPYVGTNRVDRDRPFPQIGCGASELVLITRANRDLAAARAEFTRELQS